MPVSGAHLCGFQPFVCVSGVGGVTHGHRNIRIRFRVVTELTIPVVSPGVGVSVAAHGQRMPVSGAHLCGFQPFARISGVGGVAHAHRKRIPTVAVVGGVVTELALDVPSPGVCVPVAAHGHRMIVSGADLYGFQPRTRFEGIAGVAHAHRESRM